MPGCCFSSKLPDTWAPCWVASFRGEVLWRLIFVDHGTWDMEKNPSKLRLLKLLLHKLFCEVPQCSWERGVGVNPTSQHDMNIICPHMFGFPFFPNRLNRNHKSIRMTTHKGFRQNALEVSESVFMFFPSSSYGGWRQFVAGWRSLQGWWDQPNPLQAFASSGCRSTVFSHKLSRARISGSRPQKKTLHSLNQQNFNGEGHPFYRFPLKPVVFELACPADSGAIFATPSRNSTLLGTAGCKRNCKEGLFLWDIEGHPTTNATSMSRGYLSHPSKQQHHPSLPTKKRINTIQSHHWLRNFRSSLYHMIHTVIMW